MDKLIIKDNETGNWMEIYHSENEIIIDTENDKAEIKGTFNDFERVLINNAKALNLEIQISEENTFGKILELINKNYSKLKITYTVKHEENTVLDVIEDFSKVISKDTEFQIFSTGEDYITKINDVIVYKDGEENIVTKQINDKNMSTGETILHFASNDTTLSKVNQLIDEFNDILVTFGITSIRNLLLYKGEN